MKFREMWLPLVAALALPGAVRAQEADCPCRNRPGMIGVMFDTDGNLVEGARVVEVRPGSAAERAGVRAGDVVVRLNGGSAEAVQTLPMRLVAGDTVRLHIRREGGEREVVVVAEPRPEVRFNLAGPGREDFTIIRPGAEPGLLRPGVHGEQVIIINGDTVNMPLNALTFRIDSLRTQLSDLEGSRFQIQVDSLVTVFSGADSAFFQRRPGGPPMRLREGVVIEDGIPMGEGRPFFMELGRRAAAGAELAEMNEGLSAYFGGQREGALVIDVAEDTPAARAGLQAGDVIVRAGGQEVANPEDVRRALNRAEAGQVQLEVIRQGRRRELSLEWTGAERIIQREVRPRVEVRSRRPD
jgi:S1-C subfamily serine protease